MIHLQKSSDEFGSRIGLIFAAIGAAIGTGNIWRFPRMVGANGGGTFLIPWLFFLFIWSIPLVIAEFAIGKRARTGTVGAFRIFVGRRFAWMGLWTAWISTAIGFYYAVVAGWCVKYFTLGATNGLANVDTVEVWNAFLTDPGQVILFQFIVIAITIMAIWKGAKAIESVNIWMMCSLFVMLFTTLALALWMDFSDGSLDGATFMFSIQWDLLAEPETWINGLSQSAWSCSAGMGMAITYAVYMRKDEDTVLNAATMGLANNSISIIAGLAVLSAIFAASPDPLAVVTGGSSAITFLALPEVFAQAPGGAGGRWVMMTAFFLGLSFAALTSMISTVELCVRNFVDHGIERNKAVAFTATAIFLLGLPSTFVWIKMDAEGVAFPAFLEVQDHIWGYGLMFSGLFIAFSIWKYGYIKWCGMVEKGEIEGGVSSFIKHGMSGFRDDFINTGDNDLWVPRAWDFIMYFAFPILFTVLIVSYFGDLISSFDPWYTAFNPSDPHGAGIILLFWGVVAALFIGFNDYVLTRRPVYLGEGHWITGLFDRSNWEMRDAPLFRNVPEGAEVSIETLPGGEDPQIVEVGEVPEGWEDVYGEVMDAELA